jgi:hypothetical protein
MGGGCHQTGKDPMKTTIPALAALCALSACAQTPLGPTVEVIPGAHKSFEAFQVDQAQCSQYAAQTVQGQVDRANTYGVGAAVLTTALGAGLGAAVGGGYGAGVGAASGAAVGTGLGAVGSANQQTGIQARYNSTYVACMTAKGNKYVPPTPVIVQPAPVVVQPAPYVVTPPPYYYSPVY